MTKPLTLRNVLPKARSIAKRNPKESFFVVHTSGRLHILDEKEYTRECTFSPHLWEHCEAVVSYWPKDGDYTAGYEVEYSNNL